MADNAAADEDRTFDPNQLPQTPVVLDADDELRSQPGDEDAVFNANHALRGERARGKSGHGAKTRTAIKDTISRR